MDEASRTQDVQRAAAGDSDALQRLFVHYHEVLWRKIDAVLDRKLRRHIDADDVLQQAYAAAFASIRKCRFDGAGGFYAWLETIALQKLQTAQRDLHREKRDIDRERYADSFAPPSSCQTSYADLFSAIAADQTTPSRQLGVREAAAAVASSLARLTDDQRTAILMRFREDKPVAQIAAHLGKTEDAVHMLFHRGLKALQEHLGSISQYLASK